MTEEPDPWPNDDELTDQTFAILRARGYLPQYDNSELDKERRQVAAYLGMKSSKPAE